MPVALEDILARLPVERRARIASLASEFEREEAAYAKARLAGANGVFLVYRDDQGAFRYRLLAADGRDVVTSEGFATEEETIEAIRVLRSAAADAETIVSAA